MIFPANEVWMGDGAKYKRERERERERRRDGKFELYSFLCMSLFNKKIQNIIISF